jgi:hypothetical protein
MSEMGSGSGPPPGIALIDRIVNALEPTELERRRRAAMKFIADNPDHPLVKAYKADLAKVKEKDGNTNTT